MTDELCFDMGHVNDAAGKIEPTKRNIISVASRFYDPLEVLSPFTIMFKILFQELCMKEVGWDKPLSGELLTRWRGLLKSFKLTKALVLPRCYFAIGKKVMPCRLLGFSDASRLTYTAVVYLQVETTCGSSVLFIAGKTRVSPLQDHSIPRLELLGALLLSRLLSSVCIALSKELKLGPPSCFTDSKVALFWIKRIRARMEIVC